jgi:hypothetical protein
MATATHHDAELILKLYDLRRESEMRKARNYIGLEFWPNSMDDFAKATSAPGSDANRYFRQAISFWEMAAQIVLHGGLNEDLFLDTAGEMFFFFAKFKPFLPELRKTQPELFKAIETLATRTPAAKEKLAIVEQRVAMVKQRMQQAQTAKA